MSTVMTLEALANRKPQAKRWAVAGMGLVLRAGLAIPGRRVRFDVQGFEGLPDSPVLLAANHTHFIDWIAMRWVCFQRGRMQCNWVKPRTYEEGFDTFLDLTGNIPLTSRGYMLAADVRTLLGRTPDEQEYRALRDHLDTGVPLPEGELFERLQAEPRDILGRPFQPKRESWREAIEDLFEQMMGLTLGHTRALLTQGVDLAIMPQGVTNLQLTPGHPGALQAAWALDLPLVPVGVSGFPQAFGKSHSLPENGGTIIVRFGEPYRPPMPEGHVPFRPSSERTHHDALIAGTHALMERINQLLEPTHQWSATPDQTDEMGVHRFI